MLVPCHRLFFAAQPPLREASAIDRMGDAMRDIRTRVTRDRLHATLGITDDYADFPEELADRMIEIGNGVSASPVPVALERLSGSAASVALRPARMLPGLRDVTEQLHGPMARSGIRRTGWNFNFHVTLGYREGAPFNERVDAIRWDCTEFVLIHSVVGRTEHRVLRRWPLTPRQFSLFD